MVVVQTEWMKRACIDATGTPEGKFRVLPSSVNMSFVEKRFVSTEEHRVTFFFPATAQPYKNHGMLIEAYNDLFRNVQNSARLILTLDGNESRLVRIYRERALGNGIPIEFRGVIPHRDVMDLYSKSVLVFPSLLETVGLPLVEGMACGTIVLAYDAEYSREVLAEYSDAHFFKTRDELLSLMTASVNGSLPYYGGRCKARKSSDRWSEIVRSFLNGISVLAERTEKNEGDIHG